MMKNRSLSYFLIILLIFAGGLSQSSAVSDSFENAEQAFLGDNDGIIESSTDSHFFYFEANVSEGYQFTVTGPEGTDFDTNIYDENFNQIGGFYSGSYPDQGEAAGEPFYYLEVYSYTGEGEFTLNIETTEIELGESPEYPIQLELGSSQHNTSSSQEVTFFEFDGTNGNYYQFSLNIDSAEGTLSAFLNNGDEYTSLSNTSDSSDFNTNPAVIRANNEPIRMDVYDETSPETSISFTIVIEEIDPPPGIDEEHAIPLELGVTIEQEIVQNRAIYFAFNVTDLDFYSFNFTSEQNSPVDLRITDGNGNTFDDIDGYSDEISFFKPVSEQVHYLRLRTNNSYNMTIELGRQSPPPGYTEDSPLLLEVGEVFNTRFFSNGVFLETSLEEGQSYALTFSIASGEAVGINLNVRSTDYSFQTYGNAFASSGSFFIPAEESELIMRLNSYNPENENITLVIEEIDPPPHSWEDDPDRAILGTNTGSTEYYAQRYYFEFVSNSSENYIVDLESSIDREEYISFEVFDESGNFISYGDEYSTAAFEGEGTFQIRLIGSAGITFDLTIEIGGDAPDETIYEYSQELDEGDSFSWYIEATQNGEPITGNEFGLISHERTLNLDVLVDSPVIYESDDFSNYFQYHTNDEPLDSGSDELFIMPTRITEDNGAVIEGIDIINRFFGFTNQAISEENGNYVIEVQEQGEGPSSISFSARYDMDTHHLIDLELNQNLDDNEVLLDIELVGSVIGNNPNNDDNVTPEEPAIALPLNIHFVWIAIISVPFLRKVKS